MATIRGDGKAMLAIFIGAIITIVFLGVIANSIVATTETRSLVNQSITTSATAGGNVTIPGRVNTTEVTILNITNASMDLGMGVNFSILLTQSDGTTPGLRLQTLVANAHGGIPVFLTYTSEPFGYLNNAGARSVTTLILILSALAILVTIIVILIKEGSLGTLIKQR